MGKKTAYLGMAVALSLIVSYVESLLPFQLGIPGAKLGLTNIVILIVLYFSGTGDACAVSAIRIILTGFLFGNLSAVLYSLAGGAVSLLAMAVFKKSGRFSIQGVSMIGGVGHNLGQLAVAWAVV